MTFRYKVGRHSSKSRVEQSTRAEFKRVIPAPPFGIGREEQVMNPRRRIGIAEDHTILRAGLRLLVESNPGFEVVGEAQDGIEAIKMVETLRPELVMMDLSMPRMNGMGAIREIKRIIPGTRVLVLTVHKTEEYILEALRSGADGYVLKDATQAELMHALECVCPGRVT